jgi:type VI secretion system secreted protein VgrG
MSTTGTTRYSQERLIHIKTPLEDDAFTVLGFSGLETLSSLYTFEIDLISDKHDIDFHKVLGANTSLFVEIEGQKEIVFNGIISRFSRGRGGGEEGSDSRYSSYRATLVPKLWLATQTKKIRKWLTLSSSDVIRSIIQEHGLTANLTNTGFTHDYVLQYNESDFNVIARLLEEEDMYYYFEQGGQTEHTLVSVKPPGKPSDVGTVRYVITRGGPDDDVITELEVAEEIRPTDARLADLVPKKTVDIVEGRDQTEAFPLALPVREYPGSIEDPERSPLKAKIRLGVEQAEKKILTGSSTCMAFRSGKRFVLSGYYGKENNGKFLLTSVSHQVQQTLGGQFTYSNGFTCIPSEVLFRPPRTAYRPRVAGIQTAVVTDEPDPEGWIKVRVPWGGPSEELLEHPRARVTQPWAGESYGAWFVPKVDHEVVLDFVDGDPHKPVVTGRVYNLNKKPPYDHVAHKKTTIRTVAGHELTFDDDENGERVYRYSHKDEDVLIEETLKETVGKDRHIVAKGSHLESENERNLTVKGESKEKVEGKVSLSTGGDKHQKIGTNYALEAGQEIHVKAGMTLVIEAGVQLSLKVGGNFIDIGPAGISIQGTLVNINSGGAAASGSGSSPSTPSEPQETSKSS